MELPSGAFCYSSCPVQLASKTGVWWGGWGLARDLQTTKQGTLPSDDNVRRESVPAAHSAICII